MRRGAVAGAAVHGAGSAGARGSARPGAWLLAAGLMAAYAMVFTALSAQKFRFYLYTDIDYPIFVQAVWGILHGRLTDSLRGMPWLGDHSSLVLFLVAPLFALAPSPLTLLAIQSVALALGGLPVFRLALAKLGSGWLAAGCVALYLLQPALGYANLFEFHPETLAVPALLGMLYFIEVRRTWPLAACGAAALLCREDISLPVLALAGYALVRFRRGGIRDAAWLVGLSSASLALSFLVLKPALHNSAAGLGSMYRQWGATPGEVAIHLARAPWNAIAALFVTPGDPTDTAMKLEYHLHVLLPWLALPLLSPGLLLVALPLLFEHFLSWRRDQHAIVFHYAVLVIPFVSAAGVHGLARIAGVASRRGLERGVMAALAAAALSQVLFGPLSRFHVAQHARGTERAVPSESDRMLRPYLDRIVARVPRAGAVVSGFEFLARLAQRDTVHSLHHIYRGTYTFSDRPFPSPKRVVAVIGPFGAIPAPRALWAMLAENGLLPVDAAGDLVLFLHDPPEPLMLLGALHRLPEGGNRVVFDGQLAFLGGAVSTAASPGGLLDLETHWQRTGQVDRLFLTEFSVFDANGVPRLVHRRYLGYGNANVADWPGEGAFFERYRLPLPRSLSPGRYMLGVRVLSHTPGSIKPARPDGGAPTGGVLPLGTFEVSGSAER